MAIYSFKLCVLIKWNVRRGVKRLTRNWMRPEVPYWERKGAEVNVIHSCLVQCVTQDEYACGITRQCANRRCEIGIVLSSAESANRIHSLNSVET